MTKLKSRNWFRHKLYFQIILWNKINFWLHLSDHKKYIVFLTSDNKGALSKCSEEAKADSKYGPRLLDSYLEPPSSHILASSSSDILAPIVAKSKQKIITQLNTFFSLLSWQNSRTHHWMPNVNQPLKYIIIDLELLPAVRDIISINISRLCTRIASTSSDRRQLRSKTYTNECVFDRLRQYKIIKISLFCLTVKNSF